MAQSIRWTVSLVEAGVSIQKGRSFKTLFRVERSRTGLRSPDHFGRTKIPHHQRPPQTGVALVPCRQALPQQATGATLGNLGPRARNSGPKKARKREATASGIGDVPNEVASLAPENPESHAPTVGAAGCEHSPLGVSTSDTGPTEETRTVPLKHKRGLCSRTAHRSDPQLPNQIACSAVMRHSPEHAPGQPGARAPDTAEAQSMATVEGCHLCSASLECGS